MSGIVEKKGGWRKGEIIRMVIKYEGFNLCKYDKRLKNSCDEKINFLKKKHLHIFL